MFGCTCGGHCPKRVVFDGNSLAFNARSAVLRKPWVVPSTEPRVQPGHRKLLRKLLYSGTVTCDPDALFAAKQSVEESCPGFTAILEYITCEVDSSGSGSDEAGTDSDTTQTQVGCVPITCTYN